VSQGQGILLNDLGSACKVDDDCGFAGALHLLPVDALFEVFSGTYKPDKSHDWCMLANTAYLSRNKPMAAAVRTLWGERGKDVCQRLADFWKPAQSASCYRKLQEAAQAVARDGSDVLKSAIKTELVL